MPRVSLHAPSLANTMGLLTSSVHSALIHMLLHQHLNPHHKASLIPGRQQHINLWFNLGTRNKNHIKCEMNKIYEAECGNSSQFNSLQNMPS